MKPRLLPVLALLTLLAGTAFAQADWQTQLQQELPLLGHRNWIVVVDSAYPLQSAPGVETILAKANPVDVVRDLLAELAKSKHVTATIYTDAELKFVAETSAPGIGEYRAALAKVLDGRPVQVLPHEQLIARLDEAARTFKVLIIKTPLTKPYTSVFFQLECGYWNAAAEQQLREAMK